MIDVNGQFKNCHQQSTGTYTYDGKSTRPISGHEYDRSSFNHPLIVKENKKFRNIGRKLDKSHIHPLSEL